MKRSPLKRKTGLKRSTKRGRPAPTKYKSRPRDTEYMRWVKQQVCSVQEFPPRFACLSTITPCSGPIEADHMGSRGVGRKAGDDTCAPMCQLHHVERTAHHGTFFWATQAQLREWTACVVEYSRTKWMLRGQIPF